MPGVSTSNTRYRSSERYVFGYALPCAVQLGLMASWQDANNRNQVAEIHLRPSHCKGCGAPALHPFNCDWCGRYYTDLRPLPPLKITL